MNLYSSSQATQVYYVPEWNSRETQLGSTTLMLQLNLIWANPWQSRSQWISPKGFQDRKCQALQHGHKLCWQRQGHQVPIQKSNNSVIGEGFDHTSISFADCCFQRAAHMLRKNTRPTNPHTTTTTKKSPSERKEVKKAYFHLQRLRKKVSYFSTNIELQLIDQRMATVIRCLIRAIWKEKEIKENPFSWLPHGRSYLGQRKYIQVQ